MWGYFQRRMAAQRQAERANQPELQVEEAAEPAAPMALSGMPWRFFERVPDRQCKMRTNEGASVAQRHLK